MIGAQLMPFHFTYIAFILMSLFFLINNISHFLISVQRCYIYSGRVYFPKLRMVIATTMFGIMFTTTLTTFGHNYDHVHLLYH